MTTTIALPVCNPAALAEALKDRGLPGQRSKTAIARLRRERSHRKQHARAASVQDRLNARLAAAYSAEIERRGGETTIRTDKAREAGLKVSDRSGGLTLLHLTAWRYYSGTAKSRQASLSYLCGREDGQTWAVRVPGTVTTVRAALAWLEPAAVRAARLSGRKVTRQGDVYAVETTRAHDGKGDLPQNHIWDAGARVLAHPEHGTLSLPHPVRFYAQNAYGMGRGAGRAYGD